jgi:PKD repeat protein
MNAPRQFRGKMPWSWAVVTILLCCLLVVPVARATAAGTLYSKVIRVCPPPKPGGATCSALVRVPVSTAQAGDVGVRPYKVNDGASGSGPAGGLTPAQLAGAYGYEPSSGGSGQVIGIVDAYDDPNIESDLAAFDTQYGIAACTTANGCFTKVSQTGSRTSLPPADTTGWSVEVSLDVEMAHSVCPKCKILLVETENESFTDLSAGVNEAVALGATEVSNSYGGPEAELAPSEKAAYNHPGVVIAAATGDYGYDDWNLLNEDIEPPGRPDLPASLPSVVAVGGTTLLLTTEGKRESESVWNGNGPFDEDEEAGATGGGCSTLFVAQPWQQDLSGWGATGCGDKRLSADIAADANPLTGFDIYDSYDCGTECEAYKRGSDWLTIGGTSLATPLISGLYALAGGGNGVSYPSLTLYGHLGEPADLYDVTEGGNGFCDGTPESECGHPDALGKLVTGYALRVDCEYTTACDAAPGFDGPSGVGTPNSLKLFKPKLPSAVITPPASPKTAVPASFSAAASSDPYPGGTVVSYSWSWGDGTTSTGVAPTHTFAAAGEYTITLAVADNYGLTSLPATQTVNVVARTAKELEEEAAAKKKAEEEVAAKKKAKEAEEAATKQKVEEEEASAKKKAKAAEEAIEASARTKHEEEATATAAATKRQEEEAATAAANKRREEESASLKSGLQEVASFHTVVPAPVPDVRLASTALVASPAGFVIVKVSCPSGESTCLGTVTLRTASAVLAGAGGPTKKATLTLAIGSFTVPGGGLKALTLRLAPRARALLVRVHTLRIRVTIVAHDPAGAKHTFVANATLREARAAQRKA